MWIEFNKSHPRAWEKLPKQNEEGIHTELAQGKVRSHQQTPHPFSPCQRKGTSLSPGFLSCPTVMAWPPRGTVLSSFCCFRKQLWGKQFHFNEWSPYDYNRLRRDPCLPEGHQLHLPFHPDVQMEISHVLLSGSDLNVLTANVSDGHIDLRTVYSNYISCQSRGFDKKRKEKLTHQSLEPQTKTPLRH